GGEGVAGGAPRGGGRGLPRVRPGPEPGRGRVGGDQVRAAGEPGGPRQERVGGSRGRGGDHSGAPPRPAARGPPAEQVARRLTRRITGTIAAAGRSKRPSLTLPARPAPRIPAPSRLPVRADPVA